MIGTRNCPKSIDLNLQGITIFFVYYEETKTDLQRILIHECRCYDRIKAESEGSIRLGYTGLRGGLEHLKIERRLRVGRFESVSVPRNVDRGKTCRQSFVTENVDLELVQRFLMKLGCNVPKVLDDVC
jgi:hypothetical protein